ncbi:HdeD family acid-resistance protein [Nigerium massiliense]|uniref:HdeD family acid-resistance protein n=1 Tax=Nigerium massiliense TaxID=1522317 RepID=UPI00058DB8A3|nr:DUF308 domain-containing protein [Nigerium massiliense]
MLLSGKSWPWVVLRGVLAVVLGIVALAWPGATIAVLGTLLGVWFLLDGIGSLLNAFALSGAPTGHRVLLGVLGLIGIVAGVLALTRPGVAVAALALIFAVWLILTGIGQIAFGWTVRREITGEWLIIAAGAFSAILGIVLFAWPALALSTLIAFLAIGALVSGVLQIIAGLKMRTIVRRLEERARLR